MTEKILLFDGICNLCNRAVQFIIRNDPAGKIKFASLQSDTGQKFLQTFGLSKAEFFSLVFIYNDTVFLRSDAVLQIARLLKKPWPLLYPLGRIIPRFFRDKLYNLISKNRYRIFGTRDECMVPSPEVNNRFLE